MEMKDRIDIRRFTDGKILIYFDGEYCGSVKKDRLFLWPPPEIDHYECQNVVLKMLYDKWRIELHVY